VSSASRSNHPLCPGCGYDLVATVHAGRPVCPECGCDYRAIERERQPRTPVALALLVKTALCTPALAIVFAIMKPVTATVSFWLVVLIFALTGFGLAVVVLRNLSAAVLAVPVVWLIVTAAIALLAAVTRTIPDWPSLAVMYAVAAFASLWIVREMLLPGPH
jgi:uncharacterized protein (DUF983 family)